MSLCGKVSNNKHFDCPARMNDGRHFTDYRPSCHLNNMIRANNNVLNSYDYRMFLTNNASKLMDLNRQYSCEKNCSTNCVSPYDETTMLPEKELTNCNEKGCVTNPSVFEGIGSGRVYSPNEPRDKCPGMNTMNDRTNCCATVNDLNRYYPDSKIQGEEFGSRYTMPSGGKMLSGGDPSFYF